MQQKWLVLVAVSLIFFFLNGATFASLGVVLFSMIKDLHWSQTAAGVSFSLLGIACGVASPLPALLLKRIGLRLIAQHRADLDGGVVKGLGQQRQLA